MASSGADLQKIASGETAEEQTPAIADSVRLDHGQGEEPQQLLGPPTSLEAPLHEGGGGGGGGAARDSSTEGDPGPAAKRPRTEEPPAHAASQPVPFMTAFPAPGRRLHAVNPNLVGTAVTGTVDAATGSAYFITFTMSTGEQFKGALVSPPAAFWSPLAGGPAAGPGLEGAATPYSGATLKKPRTAFNFYSDAVRPGEKEKHPRADQKTISKIVGELWAQLPAEGRAPYLELARKDKERYEEELQGYQRSFPQGPRRDLQRHQRPSALAPAELQEQQPGSGRAWLASGGAQPWQAGGPMQPDLQAPPAMMPALRHMAAGSMPSRGGWAAFGVSDVALDFGRTEAGSRDASSQPSATGGSSSLQPPLQQHQSLPMAPWPQQHSLPRAATSQGALPAARAAGGPPAPGPSAQLSALQALLQSMATEPGQQQMQQQQQQQQQQHEPHLSSALAPAIAALLQRQQPQQGSTPSTVAMAHDYGLPTASQAANLAPSVPTAALPAGAPAENGSLIEQLIRGLLTQQDQQPPP